ncbi:ATP synthase E chain-domain-containing protein [Kalaharituber pfeilii]|nr:ATP synthase E chain-domain-containing protein [Kalaharituber pfeilii]
MASPAVNVLRYTALGAGIVYGFLHQRTIYNRAEKAKDAAEYAHKEALIRQAKAEWANRHSPKSTSGVITDPNDSRFDLEAFLKSIEAESKH